MVEPHTVRNALLTALSRLFPRTRDVELRVDIAEEQDYLYLDVRLSHGVNSYRFDDLSKIPSRLKIGPRYFRISAKNRQTLKQLADWDPAFDRERVLSSTKKTSPKFSFISALRVRFASARKPEKPG